MIKIKHRLLRQVLPLLLCLCMLLLMIAKPMQAYAAAPAVAAGVAAVVGAILLALGIHFSHEDGLMGAITDFVVWLAEAGEALFPAATAQLDAAAEKPRGGLWNAMAIGWQLYKAVTHWVKSVFGANPAPGEVEVLDPKFNGVTFVSGEFTPGTYELFLDVLSKTYNTNALNVYDMRNTGPAINISMDMLGKSFVFTRVAGSTEVKLEVDLGNGYTLTCPTYWRHTGGNNFMHFYNNIYPVVENINGVNRLSLYMLQARASYSGTTTEKWMMKDNLFSSVLRIIYNGNTYPVIVEPSTGEIYINVDSNKHIITTGLRQMLSSFEERYICNRLKPNTQQGYLVNIHNHINPSLGHLLSGIVCLDDIDDLVLDCREKALSVNSIIYVLSVLRKAYSWADRQGICHNDVMRKYDFPKRSRFDNGLLSGQQIARLCSPAHSDFPIYPAVILAAKYGCRRGEILGLRMSDIDFESSSVTIQRTLSYVDGSAMVTDCKTTNSRRVILISPEDMQSFKANLSLFPYCLDGYFLRDFRGHFTQNKLNKQFHLLREALGLPYVRFHDLRHSYATFMLRQGVNPKIVSAVLGHSSVKVTLDIYTHVDLDSQRVCIAALGAL